MARGRNATINVSTRSSKKASNLKAGEADHVIATAQQNLGRSVLEIAKGHGVNVVYGVAGRLEKSLVTCISPMGRCIVHEMMDTDQAPSPLFLAIIQATNLRLYSVLNFTGYRHLHYPADEGALDARRDVPGYDQKRCVVKRLISRMDPLAGTDKIEM